MLKKIAIGLTVVVVLLVGAVLLVPRLIDWNGYKPEITAAVRDATGRDLTIHGDIEVSILPGGRFAASDIQFANAEGAEPANMATVRRIEGSVKLLPLIGGTLVVESLIVEEPVIVLQIDEEGRANWAFDPAERDPGAARPADRSGGDPPAGDLRLDDVRVTGGSATFTDARSGQTVEVREIALAVALPRLAEPLRLDGTMTVNGEPVSLEAGVDTPARLFGGERAAVTAMIDTRHVKMSYGGSVQGEPVPGLDGMFDLAIPSAAALAAWLDRPLPEGQPDPGPVEAHAVFEADGGRVAIREATLKGESLQAQATGMLDVSGGAPRLSLQVESGVLDIDRYLPPPVEGAAEQAAPRVLREERSGQGGPREERRGLTAGIPDDLFDLTALREGHADVRVAIEGIKAAGFDIGRILFVSSLENGILTADLEELNLYGGGATGSIRLDSTGETLAMETAFTVQGVQTGALGAAVTGGASPVTGVVAADLQAQGQGRSPRDLVESLSGRLAVDLGGLDLGQAATGAVSGLKLELDLPGIERPPVLAGSVVYNRERVDFRATLDPLPTVLSANRFAVDARVTADPVSVAYEGAVLKEPVPGLDGTFDLSVPAVGRLAAWLGTPLQAGQPDPGALKAQAVFSGEGDRVVIRRAVVEGSDLRAEASGSWAQEGDITSLALDIRAGVIDLDRYLPGSEAQGAARGSPPATTARGGILGSLSNEPLDFSALRAMNADVDLALDGLRAGGHEIGRTVVSIGVARGALTADIRELAAYQGALDGSLSLDASGDIPTFTLALNAADVSLEQALSATADGATMTGNLSATVEAKGRGASPRAIASAMSADVEARLSRLVLPGEPPTVVDQSDLRASMAGIDQPLSVRGDIRYEQESVAIMLDLDPPARILEGGRFALKASVESAPVNARYEGFVQQEPVVGLDGQMSLNVPAIARLLDWLGQPLPVGQSDPGSLELDAVLTADGTVVALREASIRGKGLQATANGSYDGSGQRPRIEARVEVQQADLDAYLPASPEASGRADGTAGSAAGGAAAGWSTEPLDLGFLSAANGTFHVYANNVRYRGLEIQNGRIRTELSQGVLTAALEGLSLAEGTVGGSVTVDGGSDVAGVQYALTVVGVNARPLLQAFADTRRLSGRTELRLNGSARGRNQREMVSTLNGDGELRFFDGAIHGVNLAAMLRQVGTLGMQGGEEQKTDFAELGGTFTLTEGVFENRDLRMLAPLIRLAGGGSAHLPARTIDYRVEARLVASLQGQGGDEALAGLPVPINIGGTFDNPSYQVDWRSVLEAAARDPERLKALPADVLGAARGLGVDLQGLGGAGAGAGAIGGLLRSLQGQTGTGDGPAAGQPALPLDPFSQLFGGRAGRGDASGAGTAEEPTQPVQDPDRATPAPAEGAIPFESPGTPEPVPEAREPSGEVGAPSAEAEQPAAEAEVPTTESEPPVSEAPAADAEAPASEAEQPPAEAEAPAADAEAPASEVEQPPAEAEAPAADVEAPASEAEQPPAEAEAPAADAEAPAAEAPDGAAGSTDTGAEVPATEAEAPPAEVPGAETDVPAADTDESDAERQAPPR